MESKYHLYRRETAKGAYWYYRFSDGENDIRKSTGCDKKGDAEAVIAQLEEADRLDEERASRNRARFKDVAQPMFKAGAEHLARWDRKDRALKDQTVEQHRRWIDLYLLPKWGEAWVDEIKAPAFEDWLSEVPCAVRGNKKLPLSGSTRNTIARTFLLVMSEARRAGFLERVPELELDRRHSRKKDIILDTELELLFPECAAALALMWCLRPKRERDREPPEVGIMFGALFCLMVSGGLRPGEGRAIHLDQLYRKAGGLIVDRAYDDRNQLGAPKKSREDDPRYRVAYLPERSWRILDLWLSRRKEPIEYPELLFPYHGRPIGTGYLQDRLAYALDNAGISTECRTITPHACRYTYDTKMKPILPPDVLREFVGHRSEQMTDHYDRATLRPALESRLMQLAGQRPAVERFWETAVVSK